jgi:aryl carrier-like protein
MRPFGVRDNSIWSSVMNRRGLQFELGEAHGFEAPVGDVEQMLAQLWQELLKVERVGRYDNFFSLGGHSHIALSLLTRMLRVGFQVDVRALFEAPTLMALAAAVAVGSEGAALTPRRRRFEHDEIGPEALPLARSGEEAE